MADAGENRRRMGIPECSGFPARSSAVHARQDTRKRLADSSDKSAADRGAIRCGWQFIDTFQRGVSDLDCGRGPDRRPGQISWSLTPRSPRWRGDNRGDGERSATHADRVLGTRSFQRTSTCSGRRKCVRAGWLESYRRGSSHERGNTPREALFPPPFPSLGGVTSRMIAS